MGTGHQPPAGHARTARSGCPLEPSILGDEVDDVVDHRRVPHDLPITKSLGRDKGGPTASAKSAASAYGVCRPLRSANRATPRLVDELLVERDRIDRQILEMRRIREVLDDVITDAANEYPLGSETTTASMAAAPSHVRTA